MSNEPSKERQMAIKIVMMPRDQSTWNDLRWCDPDPHDVNHVEVEFFFAEVDCGLSTLAVVLLALSLPLPVLESFAL